MKTLPGSNTIQKRFILSGRRLREIYRRQPLDVDWTTNFEKQRWSDCFPALSMDRVFLATLWSRWYAGLATGWHSNIGSGKRTWASLARYSEVTSLKGATKWH